MSNNIPHGSFDSTSGPLTNYGKGFVSQFVAVADSFQNMSIDRPFAVRTERKNIGFYGEPFYLAAPAFFYVDFDWFIDSTGP